MILLLVQEVSIYLKKNIFFKKCFIWIIKAQMCNNYNYSMYDEKGNKTEDRFLIRYSLNFYLHTC